MAAPGFFAPMIAHVFGRRSRMVTPVTRATLDSAARICAATLTPAIDADWTVPAMHLTWTCRETLDHIADALSTQAGRLATAATVQQRRFRNGDPTASVADLIHAVEIGAAILGVVAEAVPAGTRAYHRMGMADAEGYLAMGCEEILGHTWDIAHGLGIPMIVPDSLVTPIVRRLFPWAPQTCGDWDALLWCTNRIALPDRARIGAWGWWAAPLSEWPGGDGPPITWPAGM
jgi:hypothetical protein